ncbi:MAG: aspartate-alanine antiporter [Paramuribaculum sp.]|nr:aspartate-alanine antiporter [Paramuribaculum sp.]MDE6323874.1 aspartate-alanine antiporter [Paramuribaculum sp.]
MFNSFVTILREYPTLALFLTVGLGFLIGKIRIGNFSLGSVTSVLLVGVVIGQLGIPMSGPVKMVFFMIFLFSIGYSVGPDFFKSLKGDGLRQVLFAVTMSAVCFATSFLIARFMDYSKGETIGLFSGSQTCSALLGVGTEAIGKMNLPADSLSGQLNIIPVCYAVTYIFGTLGTVIILGNLGPKLLGGVKKVKQQTAELEHTLSNAGKAKDPATVSALANASYRTYRVTNDFFQTPHSVFEIEHRLHDKGLTVYIDALRHNGNVTVPDHDDKIHLGDEIVICGRLEYIVEVEQYIGEETADTTLLSYPLDRVGVIVNKKGVSNRTLGELRHSEFMHRVVIRDAVRSGQYMILDNSTRFLKGDRITIVGRSVQVKKAARHIGHVDRPSYSTDIMFVGLAIFIGGLFGAMSIWIGSIPVSFGTSGGALVAGLVFGWLRSKRPTFGNIPPGALWFMNHLGLNVFIAVVGIEAAPSFIAGLRSVGPMLFLAGAIATMIPVFFGLWLGHRVFRFPPAITLGCCAGTRTSTASLGAVQDALGSTLPAIGYTVTYAVSNILLVIWGLLTVLLI